MRSTTTSLPQPVKNGSDPRANSIIIRLFIDYLPQFVLHLLRLPAPDSIHRHGRYFRLCSRLTHFGRCGDDLCTVGGVRVPAALAGGYGVTKGGSDQDADDGFPVGGEEGEDRYHSRSSRHIR